MARLGNFSLLGFWFSLAFRAMSLVWHLEPCLPFGVQSHVFSLAFRAMSSFWRLEPCLQFGVQSHVFNFRYSQPLIYSSFRCSEPSSYVFSLAFRAIITCLQFGVQSHVYSFRRLEPPFSYAFRVIPPTGFQSHSLVVQNHSSQSWRSNPHFRRSKS